MEKMKIVSKEEIWQILEQDYMHFDEWFVKLNSLAIINDKYCKIYEDKRDGTKYYVEDRSIEETCITITDIEYYRLLYLERQQGYFLDCLGHRDMYGKRYEIFKDTRTNIIYARKSTKEIFIMSDNIEQEKINEIVKIVKKYGEVIVVWGVMKDSVEEEYLDILKNKLPQCEFIKQGTLKCEIYMK